MGIDREHWLAVRASPSLGRLFRERGRYLHYSTPPAIAGYRTLDLGRNAAKRALRKGPRKCWRVLGRA